MANVMFEEKVRYNDKFVIAALIGFMGLTAFGLVKIILTNLHNFQAIILFSVLLLTMFLLLHWLIHLQLKLTVTDKSIKFKLSPLHKSSRKIKWEEIEELKVIQTPQIAQWHGSNLCFGSTKWLSLTGRNGLYMTTRTGEEYFIGCKDVESLKNSLEKIPSNHPEFTGA